MRLLSTCSWLLFPIGLQNQWFNIEDSEFGPLDFKNWEFGIFKLRIFKNWSLVPIGTSKTISLLPIFIPNFEDSEFDPLDFNIWETKCRCSWSKCNASVWNWCDHRNWCISYPGGAGKKYYSMMHMK